MKDFLIFVIALYQRVFSILIRNMLGTKSFCRYSPSCSEYARQAIVNYGIFRGLYLSTLRILSCNPFLVNKRSL